jgi:hypothetical protein
MVLSMSLNCEEIKNWISHFSLVEECDVIRNGMLRMATPFQFANGSKIDIFTGFDTETPDQIVLSDLGTTSAYLLDVNVKPWTTKKRKQIVADICESLGVFQVDGEFKIILRPDQKDEFASAMVRLAQACIRVSDLVMTQRFKAVQLFKEEFEEFLGLSELENEAGFSIVGTMGNPVEIDFKVHGKKIESLVQTLSTANQQSAHTLANESFVRWYDLSEHRKEYQFITVYDSNSDAFKQEDLARLGKASTVFGFPANDTQIHDTLVA